ncbi:MAG: protein-L-isoaspartate O-methyltransferase [Nocardioides sp.]
MDAVSAAFEAIPREGFLPPTLRRQAAYDGPLPIGHDQTSSQPRTVADMLRLLDVQPALRVLDVGAGSGWTTALLAHLTGPAGSVDGVELVPELVTFGAGNLAATHQPWARIHQAVDGVLGWPPGAPYDRILVSAEADRLPAPLVAQLAAPDEAGAGPARLVIPVAGVMLLVRRVGDDLDDPAAVQVTRHGYYRFVPLL